MPHSKPVFTSLTSCVGSGVSSIETQRLRDRSWDAVPVTVDSGIEPMKLSMAPTLAAVAVGAAGAYALLWVALAVGVLLE